MFARVRQKGGRLQISLVEVRRVAGRVRNEHVAGLGSVADPPSVADRVAFWERAYQRLSRLSNRIGPDEAKIRAAIHARVPMPTIEEIRALQLENAKADARFWDAMREINEDQVEGHKGAVAQAEKVVAVASQQAASAAAKADAAKQRIYAIERGESVSGGIGKPLDIEKALREAGWTKSDMRRAVLLADLGNIPGASEELLAEILRRKQRAERAAARAAFKRHGLL